MRAMILAAGMGSRMMPLTAELPKPALPVLSRPIVVHLLHWLKRHGVDRAIMNLHHRPQTLAAALVPHLDTRTPELHYSFEAELLGSGGGLANARHFFETEKTVVLVNSDALHNVDLKSVIKQHESNQAAATLVCIPRQPGYGIVECAENGRILSLSGEPQSNRNEVAREMTFTGIHLLDAQELPALPSGSAWNLREVYRKWAAKGRLQSYEHHGYWWEFGTPESYLEGCLNLLKMDPEIRRGILEVNAIEDYDSNSIVRAPGSMIDETSTHQGGLILGFASRVSEQCDITDSLILQEAWVGPHTTLNRVIVGPHTEIPANSHFESCILMRDRLDEPYHREGLIRKDGLLIQPFSVSLSGSV